MPCHIFHEKISAKVPALETENALALWGSENKWGLGMAATAPQPAAHIHLSQTALHLVYMWDVALLDKILVSLAYVHTRQKPLEPSGLFLGGTLTSGTQTIKYLPPCSLLLLCLSHIVGSIAATSWAT